MLNDFIVQMEGFPDPAVALRILRLLFSYYQSVQDLERTFELFKSTVLNVTVYADKALYVHTMMVKEICLAILGYILDHDPVYLDSVAGYDWEYCRDHKDEILDLMEDCALFHDIGKYFCLEIVSNSSRRLTDDEFEIIKHHPLNFSTIYQGEMTPGIECIRDCALLHHRWYNEEGGYPLERHTANKPFVNILTIADCIDAATHRQHRQALWSWQGIGGSGQGIRRF